MGFIIGGIIALGFYKILVIDYKKSPKCKWCKSRHYGRCMFNPRSGKILANVNDGHFDYNNPNK
jgi:hypothetical protein